MKLISTLLIVCSSLTYAAPDELSERLKVAAESRGKDYLKARELLLEVAKTEKQLLVEVARATDQNWKPRLLARIVLEKLERENQILALRKYKWEYHPKYNPENEFNIRGSGPSLGSFVPDEMAASGIQYYFIENVWKDTGEGMIEPLDAEWAFRWTEFCERAALQLSVSNIVKKAMADSLARNPLDKKFYRRLLALKHPEAAGPLLSKYTEWFDKEFQPEHTQLSKNDQWTVKTFRSYLSDILAYSNRLHSEALDEISARHPDLDGLNAEIIEAKMRPPPPEEPEPEFILPPPSNFLLTAMEQQANGYKDVPRKVRGPSPFLFDLSKTNKPEKTKSSVQIDEGDSKSFDTPVVPASGR